jgi:hypothetical protein
MEDGARRRRWFVAGLLLGAAVPLPQRCSHCSSRRRSASHRCSCRARCCSDRSRRPWPAGAAGHHAADLRRRTACCTARLQPSWRGAGTRRDDAVRPRRALLRRLVLRPGSAGACCSPPSGVDRRAVRRARSPRPARRRARGRFDDGPVWSGCTTPSSDRAAGARAPQRGNPSPSATRSTSADWRVLRSTDVALRSVFPDHAVVAAAPRPKDDVRVPARVPCAGDGRFRQRRVRTADELLRPAGGRRSTGATAAGHLCRLQSADAPADAVRA